MDFGAATKAKKMLNVANKIRMDFHPTIDNIIIYIYFFNLFLDRTILFELFCFSDNYRYVFLCDIFSLRESGVWGFILVSILFSILT